MHKIIELTVLEKNVTELFKCNLETFERESPSACILVQYYFLERAKKIRRREKRYKSCNTLSYFENKTSKTFL